MDGKKFVLVCTALTLASAILALGPMGCLPESRPDTSAPPGRVLYVSKVPHCGGRSPCHVSIQAAVDAASQGDVIKVAQGVYTTTAPQVVAIAKSIRIIGGYGPNDWSLSRPLIQQAVVDAERASGRRGLSIDGRGVPTITVKGLVVRRGNAQAPGGGGIYIKGGSVVLAENAIEGCTAETRGGGVFVASGSVQLVDNVMHGNAAPYGGGLYIDGGNVLLDRNILVDNRASDMGGAVTINGGVVMGANDVVAKNTLAGAGVYLSGGHLTATHWTLSDNGSYGILAQLGTEPAMGSARLSQSIVASTRTGLGGSGVVAHRTLFYGVEWRCALGAACVNNLSGDPRFVDPEARDYHIAADSAAVDQAQALEVVSDMDGEMRPMGAAPDIGADEVQPHRIYLPIVARDEVLGGD